MRELPHSRPRHARLRGVLPTALCALAMLAPAVAARAFVLATDPSDPTLFFSVFLRPAALAPLGLGLLVFALWRRRGSP